jgi:hypothetical protein
VKKNAIAGRQFESWEAFEGHLDAWTREIADLRVHGTTGEAPMARFVRAEAQALRPIAGVPPFHALRELIRRVGSDCTVEIDGNAYSVPWRLIGDNVLARVTNELVRLHHAGREVAVHGILSGRRQRAIDPAHYAGIAGSNGRFAPNPPLSESRDGTPASLLRPLGEYEALAGGSF